MRRLRFLFLGGLLAAGPAEGLITYGDDAAFQRPPTNGEPWANVAQVGDLFGGSAVYLGNGYLLTANHVNVFNGAMPDLPIFLNGAYYALDSSFGEGGVWSLQGVDLKVLKLAGDPHLPAIPLASSADQDLARASTLIGWGVGKGASIPGKGWVWGGSETALQRYGTNVTEAAPEATASGDSLVIDFNRSLGPSTAQLTRLDSGGGLFQLSDGIWKLAGIGDNVDDQSYGQSYYDSDDATDGDQPSQSYYLRVQTYRDQILAIAAVPEPSLGLTLAMGGGILASLSSRRRPPQATCKSSVKRLPPLSNLGGCRGK